MFWITHAMSHIQHCFLAAEDFDETLSIYCTLFSDFLSENMMKNTHSELKESRKVVVYSPSKKANIFRHQIRGSEKGHKTTPLAFYVIRRHLPLQSPYNLY